MGSTISSTSTEMVTASAANRSAPSSVRLLIIGFLVGGSCTPQTQQSESPEPTSTPSLTPSPSPSLTPLPLEEARLDDEWMVRLFVRGSNFQSRPEKTQRGWIFTPRCEEGACDVILEGRVRFARDPERRLAGAEERFRVRLSRLGRSYGGLVNGFFASCETEPARDRWTFNVKVEDADYVDGAWKATRWSGSWTRQATFVGTICSPGRLRAVIRGRPSS